mmetsp:Transcript_2474/g.7140  ORF Transcript_2474/g.7140 Transcript_2474/m.7140 type:complete len:391 (-) Transcript_2474:53-1225(-)
MAAAAAPPGEHFARAKLGELFERKLYHELTGALVAFVASPAARSRGGMLLELEASFLSKIEAKLNQLAYARIFAEVVRASVDDAGALTAVEGIAKLRGAAESKKGRLGAEPALYLEMEACLLELGAPRAADDGGAALRAVKKALDEAKPTMDALTGTTDTAVFRKYYAALSEYHKQVGPPEAFYSAALSLLSYAATDDMPLAARRVLATDIALAALSGEGVYNFGEVLATPILGALEDTPNAWLGELLRVFAAGDVDAFNDLLGKHREAYLAQPALRAKAAFVKEKIALLAFMNLVFETPARQRALPFSAIAARARLDGDQVEWLAMRAMALGLVQGVIDEIARVVEVSWVQPRVLDPGQIRHLVEQIDTLSDKAGQSHTLIADQTAELI